ncbi:MAG: hypothetical protein B6D39_09395 [Anaerolineae bacterium UTCFX2]|nr:MAG: hypothetical protein B6D39_09395 [Anaerolineae bacterium UTCFX2]
MLNWQTGLIVSFLLISATVSVLLILLVARGKNVPGAAPFRLLVAGIGIWALFYAFEVASPEPASKVLWAELQYIGISVIPVGWFLFAQSYSGNTAWTDWRRFLALLIVPAITVLVALTNSAHGLLWAEYHLAAEGPLNVLLVVRYGVWWWFYFVYSYVLLLAGTIQIFQSMRKQASAFRGQFGLILASLALPWFANFSYLSGFTPVPHFDLSPIAFTLSAIFLGVAIFRFQLFDLVPLVNPTAIRRLGAAAFVVDAKNRIIEVNDSAAVLMDDPKSNPEGKVIETVFSWWNDLPLKIHASSETNQDVSLVLNGLRRYFNIQITPVGDGGADSLARLMILRDITGDRLADEALALAQIKTEFLAKVGHELRSPLTSILGIAEMLDYGVYGPLSEDQTKAVQLISDSTQHMTRIVNDLLQQSRLERGTFTLDITEFSLRDLLNRIIGYFKPMAKTKGLGLTLDVEAGVPETIRSDSLRLYQILVNLIDNAIKYTIEGEIRIRVSSSNEKHLTFQIADTGVGIPKDVQRLIFNPFQQVNPSASQRESGFGLGLSIVKQLVGLMEGTIEIESEVGKGSQFTVTLPTALEVERQR